jgi:4-oxalocrotonate tautomerase
MPVIRVDGPKVTDLNKKREFVQSVTDAASALYGLPAQAIIILLQENAPDNVGVGGQLLVDRQATGGKTE